MKDAAVSTELPLRLLSGANGILLLDAELQYDADDPLAVSALFDTGENEPVRWTFARELLHDGLHRRVGDGDLAVWPGVDGDGEPSLNLQLRSPYGSALVEAPTGVVEDFLSRTEQVVPFGDEVVTHDIDVALEAIFGGIA